MIISQRKNVQKIKKNIMQNANKRVIDFLLTKKYNLQMQGLTKNEENNKSTGGIRDETIYG